MRLRPVPDGHRPRIPIEKPSLDSFVFEGEEIPWLLRRRVIVTLVVALILLVAAYFGLIGQVNIRYEIDAEPFQEWVEDLGPVGPLGYIAVMAGSVLIAPIPNAPVFLAAGLVWGPVLGTLYSLAGLLLGSALAFWISRWVGRRYLPRLIGTKAAQRIDRASDTLGGKVIFWSRMLPVINFDWVSYVAGLTAIRFWVYFAWSAAGMVLPTTVIVVAGDGLGRDIRITLAAAAIWVTGVVLTAGYFWWRHRRWRKQREHVAVVEQAAQDSGARQDETFPEDPALVVHGKD